MVKWFSPSRANDDGTRTTNRLSEPDHFFQRAHLASCPMPLLNSGGERCALRTGYYTIGGSGREALPIASLEWRSPVATITVPSSGPSTIQRLTASVVVRVNQVLLGIAPSELIDGAIIEFDGCQLTFNSGNAGEAMVTSALNDADSGDSPCVPLLLPRSNPRSARESSR